MVEAIFHALNFNVATFVLMVINLLVVMGVLHIFLYKPVGKVLEDRTAKIEGSINEATAAREKAEQMLSEYKEQLQNARQEAQAILDRATRMGEETKEEIVNKAREESNRMLEQARAEIEEEKSKALAAIRNEAVNLAVMAASKILERNLTGEDQVRLAREAVDDVERLQ